MALRPTLSRGLPFSEKNDLVYRPSTFFTFTCFCRQFALQLQWVPDNYLEQPLCQERQGVWEHFRLFAVSCYPKIALTLMFARQ